MNTGKRNKIAVIGLDCKFPGGSNGPDQFWEALLNKKDGIISIPEDRWDHSFYYDAEGGKGKTFVDSAGFISGVFDFSPSSFGMSEKETADIDPQQRLLIQSSWNSIQNAGYRIDTIKERTGVFFGLSYRDYYDFDMAPNGVNAYTAANTLGNINAVAAGRVAYVLGLNGPAIQLDTICSSSLMTLHLACQSLLNEECDYALSGAANCILSPHGLVALAQMGALSKSARCQAFSKHADGYIRGEGVGVVLLKRLEDAERDGDYIYGVVEGTATNHDGRSNGLTAPNGKAQVKLIEYCLKKAGLSPGDIGYVEAHGTGTYLGDPVELEGLYQVFGTSKSSADPLFVGSVKSNIGHLEPAAGVASLIKSLLMLRNKVIPAGLHLEELNPGFKWSGKPIVPVNENRSWEHDDKYIGISAFSMTGANVHAILGQAPESNSAGPTDVTEWPIILSAQNETILRQYISSLLYRIDENTALSSLSNTLVNGRELFEESIYAFFSSTQEFIQELKKFRNQETNVFQKVSLNGKRKSRQLVLNIGNFSGVNAEYLRLWKNQVLYSSSTAKMNAVLMKLLGKSIYDIGAHPVTVLEQKALRFSQAFIGTDSIVSILKNGVQLNTSGHGDYLGAVFSGLLTMEESFLLFILEDESKRKQLLDRISFGPVHSGWEKSEQAADKTFWLKKREDGPTEEITANVSGNTISVSVMPADSISQLPCFLLCCYAQGVEIDWTSFLGNRRIQKVALPPAPLVTATYISESYRINSRKAPGVPAPMEKPERQDIIASMLHRQLVKEANNKKSFISSFSPEQDLFIKDHKVNGMYIFPGSGYISMIAEALLYLNQSSPIRLHNVQIFQPMIFQSLRDNRAVQLDITYAEESFSESGSWEIKSRYDQEEWTIHVKGSFDVRLKNTLPEHRKSLFTIEDTGLTPVDTQAFYNRLNNWGVEYGTEFRLVNQLKSDERSVKAVVQQAHSDRNLLAAPELLDACMHTLFSTKALAQSAEPFVPSRYDEMTIYQPLRGTILASAMLLKTDADAMKAQFSFCDEKGNPLIEIPSMEIRKMPGQIFSSGKESNGVYEEQWEKLEINESVVEQKSTTDNGSLTRETWAFLDAQQAQQVCSLIRIFPHIPQIALLGAEPERTSDAHIKSYQDIGGLIRHRQKDQGQIVLFAPPIDDINGLSAFFRWCKALLLNMPPNMSFRLCTVGGIAVHPDEDLNPFQTAVWGLARTMPIEAKHKWKGVVDIAAMHEVSLLLDPQIRKFFTTHDQLALRDKSLYTPILTKARATYPGQLQPAGNWTNPVLITGGLGQMGRVFAEQLVKRGCKKIFLLSRNPFWLQAQESEVSQLNLSQSQLDFRSYVARCQSEGISIAVVSGKVDADEDMAALADELRKQGIEDINLIHAAGAVTRHKIVDAAVEPLEEEWKAKYEGALQLDKHFRNFKVGFTVYTSSIASLWSGEGLAGYSSANLLLDGLAVKRNLTGKRTLSIRFGRFAERGLMQEHEVQELEASGIQAFPMHVAVDQAFVLAENSGLITPGIMKVDWERFTPLYQLMNHNRFLSILAPQNNISENSVSTVTDKPLREIITELVAGELEIDMQEVDPSIPLFELGLDSVHSLGIRTDLEKLLNVRLSVSLIYDFNTIDLLSKHLEELTRKVPAPPDAESKKEESEEELLQLLMQELK